ncbi:unnamed protein product [Linum trigynum]|uniref:Uncharacterized protein n=1 Tax=Linum trigynum TaxID=586398 RepID=A0AAV2EUH4_9ROSI
MKIGVVEKPTKSCIRRSGCPKLARVDRRKGIRGEAGGSGLSLSLPCDPAELVGEEEIEDDTDPTEVNECDEVGEASCEALEEEELAVELALEAI